VTRLQRFTPNACVSALKEDPTYTLAQGIELFQKFASEVGSRSAPIGTPTVQRPHQGRWCFGKTPMQTFLDALPLAKEKLMAA